MKPRRNDVPNLVALLATLVMVAAGVMASHAKAPRAPTPLPASGVHSQAKGPRKPPANQPTAQARREPRAQAPTVVGQAAEPGPARPAAALPQPPVRTRPLIARAGSAARGPLPPLMPVYGSEMASFAPPPPEMLRLTGVVRGERKIAVLRRGAKRYLVKEGDTVEGSYRVARINGNSVVLKRGTRKQVLRLGG